MRSKLITNYLPEIFELGITRSKPRMVGVNLTSRCNQNCIYCEVGQGIPSSHQDSLSTEDLIWIIDQMAENNMRRISLCGGEPFLFEGLIDVIAYAGEKHIKCSVTTNGMTAYKLNEEELKILKSCYTEVNISVDSFLDDIQSFTRGSSKALYNALKSIQVFSENQIPVTLLSAISKFNYHNLFDFVITAHRKGIKQVLFQPIISYSNYADRTAIDNKPQLNVSIENLGVLMSELEKILRFEKSHDIKTNVYRILPWIEYYIKTSETQKGWFFNDVLGKFYCRDIYAIIDISYDGGIQPCGLALAEVNIHENRHLGLIALWNKATVEIKSNLEKGKYYDFCNGCCHHFSRNMMASIFKYPFKNRKALMKMLPLVVSRIQWTIVKKIKQKK